jgi:hypothetical protein
MAAHPEESVREDVPPFGIGTELDFVDGHEISPHGVRHRFGRTDPVLRPVGNDPLLAGNERHDRRTANGDDPVIDLARKKSEGKPDDARSMREHPLDRVMGLAGVGRAEDRDDAACALGHKSIGKCVPGG